MGNVQPRLFHAGRDLLFNTSDYFTSNLADNLTSMYSPQQEYIAHSISSSNTRKIKQPQQIKIEISPDFQYPALTVTQNIITEKKKKKKKSWACVEWSFINSTNSWQSMSQRLSKPEAVFSPLCLVAIRTIFCEII